MVQITITGKSVNGIFECMDHQIRKMVEKGTLYPLQNWTNSSLKIGRELRRKWNQNRFFKCEGYECLDLCP